MRLLLDTHILLWWLSDDVGLPPRARLLIADPENDVFVSPMSLWEIAIKAGLGKVEADVEEVRTSASASDLAPLPLTLEHAVEAARLPDSHRDPFDRALIAQARLHPLTLVTHDSVLAAYGETVLLV